MSNFLGLMVFGASAWGHAEITMDFEVDPVPLVDVSVHFPFGFASTDEKEQANASYLGEMLENGTMKKTRQEFLDELANDAATFDFSVGGEFSSWSLSFPWMKDQTYQGLQKLMHEHWMAPRMTEEVFQLAQTKQRAGLRSLLDNDFRLAGGLLSRWLSLRSLGMNPVFMDTLGLGSVDGIKSVFEKYFKQSKEIWVTVVGPKAAQPVVENLVKTVFSAQGAVSRSAIQKPWRSQSPWKVSEQEKGKQIAFVIDKPQRTQMVFYLRTLAPFAMSEIDEVALAFAEHLLVENGFGSFFMDEIRTKRGLAYSVGGVGRDYYGFPALGFAANPVAARQQEALGVIRELIEKAYVTGSYFDTLSESDWADQWQSFLYKRIISESTSPGRMGKRIALLTGAMSLKMYALRATDKVNRSDVKKVVSRLWKESSKYVSVVGNVSELRPLLQSTFPDWEHRVLPYQQVIEKRGYVSQRQ